MTQTRAIKQSDPPRAIFASRYTFSAKEKDVETGYNYFGARYYSSDLSIWISVDPMSDDFPDFSPYTYCANNPIEFVDVYGEEFISFSLLTNHRPFKKKDPTRTNSPTNNYELSEVVIVATPPQPTKTTTTKDHSSPSKSTISLPFYLFIFSNLCLFRQNRSSDSGAN